MNLSPEEIGHLARALVEALDRNHGITPEQHAADHQLMRAIAQERQDKAEMYREIRENVVVWGILGALGSIVTLVWFFVTHTFAAVAVAEKAS